MHPDADVESEQVQRGPAVGKCISLCPGHVAAHSLAMNAYAFRPEAAPALCWLLRLSTEVQQLGQRFVSIARRQMESRAQTKTCSIRTWRFLRCIFSRI